MIITRLTLNNFGVYAGFNTFEFSGAKPVVLIGGMNGRGKTTFLEAILLALYGSNSFAYNESKYRTYGQYLKAYVNRADGSLESSVELEFKLASGKEESYLIKREWSGASARVREKITVNKDGEFSSFLTANWSMFIENILPSGFFFFDGEKIAELAVDSTNAQMKQSIKALLGITVLDSLGNDISRIITKATKVANNPMEAKELETLRDKKAQADGALQAADDRITELSVQLDDTNKKLEKAKADYAAKGGDIIAQRQDLFNQRSRLALRIEQEQEELISAAAGALPLALVKDLLMGIQTQASKEQESRVTALAVSKMNAVFSTYVLTSGKDTKAIVDFIQYVEKTAEAEATEIIYDLPDQSLYTLNNLMKSGLNRACNDVKKLITESQENQGKVDEIDSYLSVDLDENALSRLYKKIKELEQKIIDLEVSLQNEQQKRVSLHGEAIRAASEYGKYVESLINNLELNDDSDRLLKYAHHATKVLDAYKVKLQERKIDVLAATMTTCYKRLANKKNLINRIHMDSSTLDFEYLNAEGNIVPKESLSAGEKQLMVIALLWALAICSKKKLPVIIDTPLSRMDSNHRTSLITTYFPQASDQTIILSTDSEIDAQYYDLMKPNIGDEFTLIYNDELKCSTIERGYFKEKFNDN